MNEERGQQPHSDSGWGRHVMVDQLISARSSRLVAYARVVLALFLLASVTLGELRDPRAQQFAFMLFSLYLGYSLLILLAVRTVRLRRHLFRAAMVLLLLDVLTFTTLLYSTSGPNNSFFSPMIFVILSATVQWGSRGAVLSGLLVTALYIPSALQPDLLEQEDQLQLFMVRIGYLAMITILLAAFALHLERLLAELTRLARTIRAEHDISGELPLADCLEHAICVFGAARGVLVWQDPEEPHLTLIRQESGRRSASILPSVDQDPLVAAPLSGAVFLYQRVAQSALYRAGSGLADASGPALHPVLERMTDYARLLAIPLAAADSQGLVLILDPSDPVNEDLTVAAMLGAQISLTIEASMLQAERRVAAASEERVRLARDLHDGVLQFLAGSRLQLDLIERTGLSDEARERVGQMRAAIGEEQQQLRNVIQRMRHVPEPSTTRLADAMDQVADHLSRSWNAQVRATVQPKDLDVPHAMEEDVVRLTREAVANSVRHGAAGEVEINVRGLRERLSIRIADDGRGFSFEGQMSHEELAGFAGRPRSLHSRVSTMGGRMRLTSSHSGTQLSISVPLQRAG